MGYLSGMSGYVRVYGVRLGKLWKVSENRFGGAQTRGHGKNIKAKENRKDENVFSWKLFPKEKRACRCSVQVAVG